MHVYAYTKKTYTYTHTHIQIYKYTHIHVYAYTNTHIHTYMHACMHAWIHTREPPHSHRGPWQRPPPFPQGGGGGEPWPWRAGGSVAGLYWIYIYICILYLQREGYNLVSFCLHFLMCCNIWMFFCIFFCWVQGPSNFNIKLKLQTMAQAPVQSLLLDVPRPSLYMHINIHILSYTCSGC